jgi:hypothetical protein
VALCPRRLLTRHRDDVARRSGAANAALPDEWFERISGKTSDQSLAESRLTT